MSHDPRQHDARHHGPAGVLLPRQAVVVVTVPGRPAEPGVFVAYGVGWMLVGVGPSARLPVPRRIHGCWVELAGRPSRPAQMLHWVPVAQVVAR